MPATQGRRHCAETLNRDSGGPAGIAIWIIPAALGAAAAALSVPLTARKILRLPPRPVGMVRDVQDAAIAGLATDTSNTGLPSELPSLGEFARRLAFVPRRPSAGSTAALAVALAADLVTQVAERSTDWQEQGGIVAQADVLRERAVAAGGEVAIVYHELVEALDAASADPGGASRSMELADMLISAGTVLIKIAETACDCAALALVVCRVRRHGRPRRRQRRRDPRERRRGHGRPSCGREPPSGLATGAHRSRTPARHCCGPQPLGGGLDPDMSREENGDAMRPVGMSNSQWRQLAGLSERELAALLRLLSPAPLSWREAARAIPVRLGDQVESAGSSEAPETVTRGDESTGASVRAGEFNDRGRV